MDRTRLHRWMRGIGIIGGLLLVIIGVRYLLVPESAARTFGLALPTAGYELHFLVGLRNIWLGLLAVAFAALREWRALMLWAAAGTVVCFADAAIAAASSGRAPQVAFHAVSGVVCAASVWPLSHLSRGRN